MTELTRNPIVKKNTLNQPHSFQLASWLEKNLDSLAKKGRPSAAEAAQKALGFMVTEANIRGAELAIGKSIEKPRAARANHSLTTRDTSRLLAKALLHLYQQLQEPASPELEALARR